MTKAEFEVLKARMIDGVIAQGKPSMSEMSELCKFRGAHGLKCAVGMIIPDDKYREEMDSGLMPLENLFDEIGIDLTSRQIEVVERIQVAHDVAADVRFDEGDSDGFVELFRIELLKSGVLKKI